MNRKLATGILALTALFVGSSTAAEILEDGTYFLEDGVYVFSIEAGGGHLRPCQVTRQEGKGDLGDGIYTIEWLGSDKDAGNLYAENTSVGTSVSGNKTKSTKWVLHKGSKGWGIMLAGTEENAVTLTNLNPLTFVLQRNQGVTNQLWKIK